jgi:hypothetical protein
MVSIKSIYINSIFLVFLLLGCSETLSGPFSNVNREEEPVLMLSSIVVDVPTSGSYQFTVTGGTEPYTYEVQGTFGTIGSATGLFQAGATAGTVTVMVYDSAGHVQPATVNVETGLAAAVTFAWAEGTYGTCNATCGPGTQTRTVACTGSNGDAGIAADCEGPAPSTTQTCEIQACPATLVFTSSSPSTNGYAACSTTCEASAGCSVAGLSCTAVGTMCYQTSSGSGLATLYELYQCEE